MSQESAQVVIFQLTQITFDYKLADNQLKTLCNFNEDYYQIMSKLILSLSAKYSAEQIHGFLKGWNNKVAESIENEFDQIAKPILLGINEIVQTDNFQQIINIGTKVIADYIEKIKEEPVIIELEIEEFTTIEKSLQEIKEIEVDNTYVVQPIIE